MATVAVKAREKEMKDEKETERKVYPSSSEQEHISPNMNTANI